MDDTYEYTKNSISNNSILNIDLRHLEVVREKAREKSCINLNYNMYTTRESEVPLCPVTKGISQTAYI